MKNTLIVFTLLLAFYHTGIPQVVPVFDKEISVNINGYFSDAMEPCISPDGNALFFNSLNDGITTSLYYSSKINDSTFNFIGYVPVVNQSITPRLDAVASLDSAINFFWISTREYPANYENIFRIRFLTNSYTNFGRVHGDFYVHSPGHLIMDASVNYSGNLLIYCNAFFNGCANGLPCSSSMGMAQKINDSTYNKLPDSETILANINDTSQYLVYAPCLSKDGLELYYTRLQKNGFQTEIMVSVRTSISAAFGVATVLISAPSNIPEAPSLSSDQMRMYYHKKVGNVYRIFLRYRNNLVQTNDLKINSDANIFYNPKTHFVQLSFPDGDQDNSVEIFSVSGQIILKKSHTSFLDLNHLKCGIYFMKMQNKKGVNISKISIQN